MSPGSSHSLCLVGSRLSQPKIESLRAGLIARGFGVGDSRWLSPHYALDLSVDMPGPLDCETTAAVVRDVRRALPQIDVALVANEHRAKSLLVADMDSTLITSESIVEIARAVGLEREVESLTSQAMRGRLGFVEALIDRLKLVVGVSVAAVEALGPAAVLSPGAARLCATMAANGARLVMASGGFTQIADVVAARLGIHRVVANQLVVADGQLTGGVHLPVVDGALKAEILTEEMTAAGLASTQVLAVGDGANDAAMVRAAGLGVAYCGKPALQQVADAAINYTDLTTLLYFQGYDDSQFIQP